jgi:zinc/manganese transport system ATP-binding protein
MGRRRLRHALARDLVGARVIALQDVTVAYERHPAVHHLSGGFEIGSLTAVVGPNGAGKSSLLKALAGLVRPIAGRIELAGIERGRIAYLPQVPDLDRRFPISVHDLVLLGHWRKLGWLGGVDRALLDQAAEAIRAVGLGGFERRPIGTLSAGQLQRALFARLMLQDAALILLDEPFNAIDTRTAQDLIALVDRWHGEHRTVIAVLHDLEQVRQHFPSALLLARHCIGWGPTERVLTPTNLLAARHMSESWDPHAEYCEPAAAS